jgi:hypothetical protein
MFAELGQLMHHNPGSPSKVQLRFYLLELIREKNLDDLDIWRAVPTKSGLCSLIGIIARATCDRTLWDVSVCGLPSFYSVLTCPYQLQKMCLWRRVVGSGHSAPQHTICRQRAPARTRRSQSMVTHTFSSCVCVYRPATRGYHRHMVVSLWLPAGSEMQGVCGSRTHQKKLKHKVHARHGLGARTTPI